MIYEHPVSVDSGLLQRDTLAYFAEFQNPHGIDALLPPVLHRPKGVASVFDS